MRGAELQWAALFQLAVAGFDLWQENTDTAKATK